jgi:Major intrinsic protein
MYFNYQEAFHRVDPGKTFKTQGVFSTLPNGVTVLGGFRDQIILTAILVMLIFALIDERNTAPGANMAPFMIGILIVAIGEAFGSNSGWAINPARDFGPPPVRVDRRLGHRVEGQVRRDLLLGPDHRPTPWRPYRRRRLRPLHRPVPAHRTGDRRGRKQPPTLATRTRPEPCLSRGACTMTTDFVICGCSAVVSGLWLLLWRRSASTRCIAATLTATSLIGAWALPIGSGAGPLEFFGIVTGLGRRV